MKTPVTLSLGELINILVWYNLFYTSSLVIITSLVRHDIVMDCTDNLATRYLLNDACAACGPIPLVSGSALRFEGQMTVYLTHHLPKRHNTDGEAKRLRLIDEEKVPCFRCINPTPPPAVQACSDAGVLGVGKLFPSHLCNCCLCVISWNIPVLLNHHLLW